VTLAFAPRPVLLLVAIWRYVAILIGRFGLVSPRPQNRVVKERYKKIEAEGPLGPVSP
jgi:hypothetical protein